MYICSEKKKFIHSYLSQKRKVDDGREDGLGQFDTVEPAKAKEEEENSLSDVVVKVEVSLCTPLESLQLEKEMALLLLENGIRVKVMAGKYGETEGPVNGVATEPVFLDIRLPPNTNFEYKIPNGHTCFACKKNFSMLKYPLFFSILFPFLFLERPLRWKSCV